MLSKYFKIASKLPTRAIARAQRGRSERSEWRSFLTAENTLAV